MHAWHNEYDPKAAAWLRQLITDGALPPGSVDERSISDLRPQDIPHGVRAHFFAGIGGWEHALQLAGWPDDLPIWTGSCPCQPFSTSGKRKGFADERHLWPVWFELIRECRPAIVVGEQVARGGGLGWLDLVFSDMEGIGYACAAADIPAGAAGAPHERRRLWWVAIDVANGAGDKRSGNRSGGVFTAQTEGEAGVITGHGTTGGGAIDDVADRDGIGRVGSRIHIRSGEFGQGANGVAGGGAIDVVGNTGGGGGGRDTRALFGAQGIGRTDGREPDQSVHAGTMGDADGGQSRGSVGDLHGKGRGQEGRIIASPSGLGGFWASAQWIPCRDGKWRAAPAAESGIFPLAHGFSESMVRISDQEYCAAQEVMKYADTCQTDSREVLRMVWEDVCSGTGWKEQAAGMCSELYAPQVLFPFMQRVQATCDATADGSGVPKTGEQTQKRSLRGVRNKTRSVRASSGRKSDEQHNVQSPNTLRELSLILACRAEAHASAQRDANASAGRVGRIRGTGNAIVPQVAAAFIQAVMEVLHV